MFTRFCTFVELQVAFGLSHRVCVGHCLDHVFGGIDVMCTHSHKTEIVFQGRISSRSRAICPWFSMERMRKSAAFKKRRVHCDVNTIVFSPCEAVSGKMSSSFVLAWKSSQRRKKLMRNKSQRVLQVIVSSQRAANPSDNMFNQHHHVFNPRQDKGTLIPHLADLPEQSPAESNILLPKGWS
jgi:hypothetical protein